MLGSRWYGYLLTTAVAFTGFQVGWAAANERVVTVAISIAILVLIVAGGVNHAWRLVGIIEDTARSEGYRECMNQDFKDRFDALHDRIDDLHAHEDHDDHG